MIYANLPTVGKKPGGVDIFVDGLATALALRGHDVHLYTAARGASNRPYHVIPAFPEAYTGRGSRLARLPRLLLLPLFINLLDLSGFDVVHLHGDDWFYIRRGLPSVRTFYGSALQESRSATSTSRRLAQRAIYSLELLSARLSSANVGIGDPSESAYSPLVTIPCAIDDSFFSATREPTPFPSVLFVGTLQGRKRGSLVESAFFRDILPRHPDAQLWMVADAASHHPNVRLFTGIPRGALIDLYRRAWLFCLPSSYEGFGIPYAEALATRVPIVATANPGSLNVLAGGAFGRIVAPEDLGSELLQLITDESLRERLSEVGFTRAEDFHWDRVCTAYEQVYATARDRWSDSGRAVGGTRV